MARKYNIAIRYKDGRTREYLSAQGLERNIKICKNEDDTVWFKIEPEHGYDPSLVREFSQVDGKWSRLV